MKGMRKFQFTLRHVLLWLPVVAVLLVLLRFVNRSQGLAVALLIAAIAALILFAANVLLYVILRVIGLLSSEAFDWRPADRPQDSAPSDPALR